MARLPRSPAKANPAQAAGEERPKERDSAPWMEEIDAALRREDTWRKRGKEVIQRYRDERGRDTTISRVNILWSNTEVLKSALYNRTAKPDVRRRFPDAKRGNSAARYAAEVLERSLSYVTDAYDVDAPVEGAVEDLLLPGRGVIWVTYEPEIDGDTIGEQKLCPDYVYWEDFCHGLARTWSRVPWVARRHAMPKRDFLAKFPHARPAPDASTYELTDSSGAKPNTTQSDSRIEVWEIWHKPRKERIYVARGYLTVLQADPDPLGLKDFFPVPRPLYSVKTTDRLIPEPLFNQYQDQAAELDIVASRIRKLIEYLKWIGIYDASVSESVILKDLAEQPDGTFLPHASFQQIRDKGGIDAALGFWPIERIGPVVLQLSQRQADLTQKIYEITGISDVIRGSTMASETATAQQIKAEFGSQRLQQRQREVQRFIRDTYRIMAEIIAEHFTQESLATITAIELPATDAEAMAQAMPPPPQMGHNGGPPMLPPPSSPPAAGGMMPGGAGLMALGPAPPQAGPSPMPPGMPPEAPQMPMDGQQAPPLMQDAAPQPQEPKPSWEQVMAILRSDKLRGFRIDIETDSTLVLDSQAEKQERIEFGAAFQQMLQGAYVAATTAPMMLPLIKEAALFLVRTYKPGRVMEEALEDAFEEVAKNPPPNPNAAPAGPPPPPPLSEGEKAKLELEAKKAEGEQAYKMTALQADQQHKGGLLQLESQKAQTDAQLRAAQLQLEQQKLQIEQQRVQIEQNNTMLAQQQQEKQLALEGQRLAMQGDQFDRTQEVQSAQYETNRKDKGLPEGHAIVETAAQWQQQAAQLGQVLDALTTRIEEGLGGAMQAVMAVERNAQALAQAVQGLADQMSAPVEIVRDASGRAVGARKGAMQREVVRGPDGTVTGLQ